MFERFKRDLNYIDETNGIKKKTIQTLVKFWLAMEDVNKWISCLCTIFTLKLHLNHLFTKLFNVLYDFTISPSFPWFWLFVDHTKKNSDHFRCDREFLLNLSIILKLVFSHSFIYFQNEKQTANGAREKWVIIIFNSFIGLSNYFHISKTKKSAASKSMDWKICMNNLFWNLNQRNTQCLLKSSRQNWIHWPMWWIFEVIMH